MRNGMRHSRVRRAVTIGFVSRRALLRAAAVTLALTASAGLWQGRAADAAESHSITLRGKFAGGAWKPTLSRKLDRNRLIAFSLCAVWDQPTSRRFNCAAAQGVQLPEGTELRLEQRPAAAALKLRDSPGWGLLGVSGEPSFRVPLSNGVTGNRFGTVTFRVTLRERSSGKVLYRSNALLLRWRR
jgi:hypothetical protein